MYNYPKINVDSRVKSFKQVQFGLYYENRHGVNNCVMNIYGSGSFADEIRSERNCIGFTRHFNTRLYSVPIQLYLILVTLDRGESAVKKVIRREFSRVSWCHR